MDELYKTCPKSCQKHAKNMSNLCHFSSLFDQLLNGNHNVEMDELFKNMLYFYINFHVILSLFEGTLQKSISTILLNFQNHVQKCVKFHRFLVIFSTFWALFGTFWVLYYTYHDFQCFSSTFGSTFDHFFTHFWQLFHMCLKKIHLYVMIFIHVSKKHSKTSKNTVFWSFLATCHDESQIGNSNGGI